MKKVGVKFRIKAVSIFLVLMLVMPIAMSGCEFIDFNNNDNEQANQNGNKNENNGESNGEPENNGGSNNNDESVNNGGEDVGNENIGEEEDGNENGDASVYVRCDKYGNEKADGEYILFGEYPQTIKDDNVSVTDTKDSRGYYLGSDGFYYAKIKATPCASYYTFTTGAEIDSNVVYYFKVEPIRWRILGEKNGEAIILCDSIIDKHVFDDSSNNYAESDIRAWLNSLFYDTAFSSLQKELILTTEVDNSVKSANPCGDEKYFNNGVNKYACENTSDKIFLLSEEEVTNSSYGFNGYVADTARKMMTSDYSRAVGAMMNTDGIGWWWLRSPYYSGSHNARGCIDNGNVQIISVNGPREGVVPALTIKLQEG